MVDLKQIAELHDCDVRAARGNIRAACDKASAEWIPSNAIADALFLEYIEQSSRTQSNQEFIRELELRLRTLRELSTPHRLQ